MKSGSQYRGFQEGWIAWAIVSFLLPMTPWAGAGRPAWVDRFPSQTDAYIGIGHVDKRLHPIDYRERAQAAALAQISREISIQVKTVNASLQKEDGNGWEESFSQKTETVSKNSLSGYQLAEVYETSTELWAMYSLDKEIFQEAQVLKERELSLWLSQEIQAINSDFDQGWIQKVVDRSVALEKRYATFYAENPLIMSRDLAIQIRHDEIILKVQQALNQSELMSHSREWVFTIGEIDSAVSIVPRVLLVDKTKQYKWKGPFSLILFNMNSRKNSTKSSPYFIETDCDGKINLLQTFKDGGLEAGELEIRWNAMDDKKVLRMKTVFKPIDLGLNFRSEVSEGLEKKANRILKELSGLQGRYFRIVPDGKEKLNLQIRLDEIREDSLEGIYFSSIRARVLFPGFSAPFEIQGKSGHSNMARAFEGALRDFIRGLEVLPWKPLTPSTGQ